MKLVKMGAFLMSMVFPFIAGAASITCGGTVTFVGIHQPGFVVLQLSSMNTYGVMCRVDADYTPPGAALISPATCRAIYAGLLAAKINKSDVSNIYFDGDLVPSSCTGFQGLNSQVNLRFMPIN